VSVDQTRQQRAMLEENYVLNVVGRSHLQNPRGVIAPQSGVRLKRARYINQIWSPRLFEIVHSSHRSLSTVQARPLTANTSLAVERSPVQLIRLGPFR
jgi:hypothetical protein